MITPPSNMQMIIAIILCSAREIAAPINIKITRKAKNRAKIFKSLNIVSPLIIYINYSEYI